MNNEFNKKIRVLYVVSSFPALDNHNNGQHNFRSVKNINENEELIQVLHLRSWNFKRSFWEVYKIDDINIWCFSFPFLPSFPLFFKGLNMMLYKFILYLVIRIKNQTGFTIIHSSGLTFSGIIGAYIAKKIKIKHIAQCMGTDVNVELPRVLNIIGYKGLKKNVDIFICNSKSLEISINRIFLEKKSLTLYRGVNLNEFQYSKVSIENNFKNKARITFLYLGGLVELAKKDLNYKGGVTLLKAWKSLKISSNSDIKVEPRLIFAGPGVNSQKVEKLINCDADSCNIEVLSQMNKEMVIGLMKLSSVVIVPSLSEGLPNVAMEAMATGRPVIGSNIGGIPELVIHNETGLLHQAANSEELSRCIKKYIDNPNLIMQHGNTAHRHIERHFNSKVFTEEILNLYYKLS